MDASFWNERYVSKEYVYGKEPNTFFKDFIHQKLRIPGKLLLPAEGEGRNAVFAALNGYQVTAFDFSKDAKNKAQLLASEKNISIEYLTSDISSFDFTNETYDVVGLFFVHLPPVERTTFHASVISSLLPGGLICLEAFHTDQIALQSGGPKKQDMLMDIDQLANDFKSMEILHIAKIERVLDEGPFHQGKAVLVQLIAKKK
jgi:2-polyprenyl-3-methyl-5-hydroxy-6-metoxy-1,4-benzoquinol methylase